MNPEALLLLKNLLARLDADAGTERPQFLGIVSEAERNALRLVLEDAGSPSPVENGVETTEPVSPPREENAPLELTVSDDLNIDALRLTASPEPRWTLCLDFGTAKSKAFAATDDEEDPEFMPLPIGKADEDRDGSVHEMSSSIWIDNDGVLFLGSEAVKRGSRLDKQTATNRHRLDSVKQELSQVRGDDGPEQLERPLPKEIDPTSTLTYLDVVTVYLAYLTDLAVTEMESRLGTRYVRRRFTLPWWPKEHRRWVGDVVTKRLKRAQVLADTFHGDWRRGISVERIKSCVREAAVCDGQLDWMFGHESGNGVLEALAAGSARLWTDRSARELMLVVDVGAGTTDLSIFWVVQDEKRAFRTAQPVEPCGRAIKQAGNNLDSLLVGALIRKAHLGEDLYMKKRVGDSLWRGSVRRLKERLFETGQITETLVSDHTVTLSRDEFLGLEEIRAFERGIVTSIQELLGQVHETWGAAAAKSRGITLVLTGGGCRLPMIKSLADQSWKLGRRTVRFRLAPDVPDGVRDKFSAEFIREYPKLAVAMGGALPMRLDEGDAQAKWYGNAEPPGQLEKFATRGV